MSGCHDGKRVMADAPPSELTLALAGQPNVGKSTVFNLLTGLNQHVGNWTGKTVERRSGSFVHDGVNVTLIDLPGTYSLTAASPEEVVARDYIIHERPDAVIVILNAAALERNLYLVAELLALPVPLVIGLNMMDVARQEGYAVDAHLLSEAIGVPVLPMTATRAEGVHALVDAALRVARVGVGRAPSRPTIREDHRALLAQVQNLIAPHAPTDYPLEWLAVKLLEGDGEMTALLRQATPPEAWAQVQALLVRHEDALIAVASGRYEWISQVTRAALQRPRAGQVTLTQRLDAVATHPFGGLLALAAVLAAIFGLTYFVGGPLQQWMDELIVGNLAALATRLLAGAPSWVTGLVVDGILGGVGTMLTFVPILVIFFVAMGLLEDVGYMARAAYMMDRYMHALGLHGKSFVPLFLGFGCNVPAIIGTRVIEAPRSRLLTIMLMPLVPCTARLAVLTVLARAFFPAQAALVAWVLTGLPLVVLALVGILAHRMFLRGENAALIMEMPLYHLPNWRTIGLLVWWRLLGFLQKAGTIILAVSVVVWALATLPHGEIETSYLATLGNAIAPLGALMGMDWRALVALLTSFVAKENSVATLGVLYGVTEDTQGLAQLATQFSPASALAFLVAQMLFIPCASTFAVIRQETGSWRWPLLNMAFLALLTFLGGVVAYQIAALVL
jgi:ferrous iron transport protein B